MNRVHSEVSFEVNWDTSDLAEEGAPRCPLGSERDVVQRQERAQAPVPRSILRRRSDDLHPTPPREALTATEAQTPDRAAASPAKEQDEWSFSCSSVGSPISSAPGIRMPFSPAKRAR